MNIIDMSQKPGGVNSFCFDMKGKRTIMSMDNCCTCVLTDYQAPEHRRETKLEVR